MENMNEFARVTFLKFKLLPVFLLLLMFLVLIDLHSKLLLLVFLVLLNNTKNQT